MNNSPTHSFHKYFLIGGTALAVLLLIAIVALNTNRPQMKTDSGKTDSNTIQNENAQNNTENTAPTDSKEATHKVSRITFDTVSLPSVNVPTPSGVSLYKFKQYDVTDVERIASVLGLPDRKTENGSMIAYGTTDEATRGWLMVDSTRGVLTYRFYGNQPQAQAASTPQQTAQSFLQKLGVIDTMVDCSITYQKTAMPDVTMVECHRDWKLVGLPIINFVGLINIPKTTQLAQMELGKSYGENPDDPTIVNTSTNQDGYRRPDDFNTATVAVHTDGTILGFSSNIRPIAGTQKVAPTDFVALTNVQERITKGQTNMFFIRPDAAGVVNWDAFFGTTAGSGATVTDLMLAYVEIPGQQEYLAPMYVARGTAQLGSYRALFFAADPATRIGLSANTQTGGEVAGISTQYLAQAKMDESLKLSTFGFAPATSEGMPTEGCEPAANQLYPLIDLPPFGMVGPFTINNEGHKRANTYYLIPSNPDILPEINGVVAMFDSLNLEGRKAELREMHKLQDEWSAYSRCPLRLSGSSPSIFVYAPAGTHINVHPASSVIYHQPALTNGSWVATAQENGSVKVNGVSADYLYYEYTPVEFSQPKAGWNVKKSNLVSFVQQTLAAQLGLTKQESDRLVYEVTRATFDMTDDVIYIAPLEQKEIDAKLPLTVTGVNDVIRIHFYVGAENPGAHTTIMSPIARTSSMLLELGATK